MGPVNTMFVVLLFVLFVLFVVFVLLPVLQFETPSISGWEDFVGYLSFSFLFFSRSPAVDVVCELS